MSKSRIWLDENGNLFRVRDPDGTLHIRTYRDDEIRAPDPDQAEDPLDPGFYPVFKDNDRQAYWYRLGSGNKARFYAVESNRHPVKIYLIPETLTAVKIEDKIGTIITYGEGEAGSSANPRGRLHRRITIITNDDSAISLRAVCLCPVGGYCCT